MKKGYAFIAPAFRHQVGVVPAQSGPKQHPATSRRTTLRERGTLQGGTEDSPSTKARSVDMMGLDCCMIQGFDVCCDDFLSAKVTALTSLSDSGPIQYLKNQGYFPPPKQETTKGPPCTCVEAQRYPGPLCRAPRPETSERQPRADALHADALKPCGVNGANILCTPAGGGARQLANLVKWHMSDSVPPR